MPPPRLDALGVDPPERRDDVEVNVRAAVEPLVDRTHILGGELREQLRTEIVDPRERHGRAFLVFLYLFLYFFLSLLWISTCCRRAGVAFLSRRCRVSVMRTL